MKVWKYESTEFSVSFTYGDCVFFYLIFLFFEFPVAAVDCILLGSGTATIEVACLCRKVSDQFAFFSVIDQQSACQFGIVGDDTRVSLL